MRLPRRTTPTAVLAALALAVPLAAGPVQAEDRAAAAVAFGAPTGGAHNFGLACGVSAGQTCEMTSVIQGLALAHQAPGGAVASSAGVVTSWSMSHGPLMIGGGSAVASTLQVALRVVRGTGASGVGVGAGPMVDLPQAPGTYTFPVRVPVQAGDRIGYDLRYAPGNIVVYGAIAGTPGDEVGFTYPFWPSGTAPTNYQSSVDPPIEADVYLPINATIEPDADADGYGDLTQDLCAADPTRQGACDVTPPRTTITKKPAMTSQKSRAKFRFRSSESDSTFACRLKGPGLPRAVKRFRPCTSPKVYKRLAAGTYAFSVRATDKVGNTDATPAVARFTVIERG